MGRFFRRDWDVVKRALVVMAACFAIHLNGQVIWTGDIVNTGTLSVSQAVTVDGTASLTGGGIVVLSTTDSYNPAQIDGNSNDPVGTDELINVDNTIRGSGIIGEDWQPGLLSIVNDSLIQASGGNWIGLSPNLTGGIVNSGTLKAVDGG